MTIQQVVAELQEEKKANLPSRFPCRAIMVKTIAQYCQLLSELKKISDIRIVKSKEIFPSSDVMPKYENLKQEKYRNEWVILTGVSEYLRLFSKKEAVDRRFNALWSYQAPSTSTGRIIIPMWGCEAQWFDSSLHLNGDLRQADYYYDCAVECDEEQEMSLLVLSGLFEQKFDLLESMQGNFRVSLQEWFEYWENPNPANTRFVLLTKRSKSITTTNDKISIHVMNDMMSFIREKMAGARVLDSVNCSEQMQNVLFDYALKGIDLDAALLSILNVASFSDTDVMGKWSIQPMSHKQFIALWFKLHPDDGYLSHCFARAKSVDKIPSLIAHEIFKMRLNKPEWVDEYRQLATVMHLKPDNSFFEEIDNIPEYDTKLDFLTGDTREERIYLLKMVGTWMRKDPAQVVSSEKLRKAFPTLAAYLSRDLEPLRDDLGDYLSVYKAHKLANTLPNDDEEHFEGIRPDQYEYRYAVVSEDVDEDTIVLWIDALGVEWLPLLYWGIINNCDAKVKKVAVTQATLPTDTMFNDQWLNMGSPHQKLNKLDKLAHKGVIDEPDYYSCIEDQLAFVASIGQSVSTLLNDHHRVIVTGDHGTSRLAARFFHVRDGVPAPGKAKVCSHGRYCILADGSDVKVPYTVSAKDKAGNKCLVFRNYDHFSTPGFAAGAEDDNAIYGEVHGGASPEEMLVPVIIVDGNHEIPLSAVWDKTIVKISKKKVRLNIRFSRPVSQVKATIEGISGTVTSTEGDTSWTIVFEGLEKGDYIPHVVADGALLAMSKIKVKPALGGGDGDLP